jgi:hypothetical protein
VKLDGLLSSLRSGAAPYILGAVAVAGWTLAGRVACARKTDAADATKKIESLAGEAASARVAAEEAERKARSWKLQAAHAEDLAEGLRKAPRITDAPPDAGVRAVRAGDVVDRPGLLIDRALAADSAVALEGAAECARLRGLFDTCAREREELEGRTGFWPSAQKYALGGLFGLAVGLAVR